MAGHAQQQSQAHGQGQQAGHGGQEHAGAGARGDQSKAAWNDYVAGLDQEGGVCEAPADEHGGAPAESHGPPEPKKEAVLDLNKAVTTGVISACLDAIANEPGERGRMAIEIKVEGKVPVGPVSAMGAAWAELQLLYYMNDQNFHVLEVDVAGAVQAGIDLAGFFTVGGEVGYETDFMNSWFSSSGAVAVWLIDQLKKLDEFAGGGLISFGDEKEEDHGRGGGHGADPNAPQYQLHDSAVFGGAFVEAEMGDAFKGEASYTAKQMKRTYHDQEHNEFHSTEDHRILKAGLEVQLGRFAFAGEYTRDWSNTTGSPIYYTNGVFVEHDLMVSAGMKELFPQHFGKKVGGLPTKPAQDLVVNTFAAMEKLAGYTFPFVGQLNASLFNQVVEEMYQSHHKGHAGINVWFDVIFNWNTYGEVTGENRLMYFRVKVQPRMEVEVGANTPVGGVELEASRSKSEVVYESIGAETVSYVQRQFLYETEDRPWSAFVAKNDEQIRQLVENVATPGFLYHAKSVEAAYGEDKNYEAGLAALERHWRQEDALVGQVAQDAATVGDELDSATSMFTWFQATKDAHMGTIYQVLLKYSREPKMMKFFFAQLPAYGVDLEALHELAQDTGHGSVYQRLRGIADQAN